MKPQLCFAATCFCWLIVATLTVATYISYIRNNFIEKEKTVIEKTQELNNDIHKSIDIPDKERFVSRDTGVVMNGSELFVVTDKQTGKEYMSAQYYGFVELK